MDKRIGFGARFGAWVIDAIAVCMLTGIAAVAVGGTLGAKVGAEQSGGSRPENAVFGGIVGSIVGLIVLAPIIGSIYFLVEGMTGLTPGKMMLGLRVGMADGTRAPMPRLLLRYVCKHPHFVFGVVGLLTFTPFSWFAAFLGPISFLGCFAALGERKQALHDLIAGTAVYLKEALAPAAAP